MVELRCWNLRRIGQEDYPCTVFGPFYALEFYRTTELFGVFRSNGQDVSCLIYHNEGVDKYWQLCPHLREHADTLLIFGRLKDTYASFQVAPYSEVTAQKEIRRIAKRRTVIVQEKKSCRKNA